MNSNRIGNIGEKYFELLMTKLNIPCFKPINNYICDYVVFYNNNFIKFEIKTSATDVNGAVTFSLRKSKGRKKLVGYEEKDTDYFFCYSTVHNEYAFYKNDENAVKGKTFRIEPTDTGGKCSLFSDYKKFDY